MPKRPDSNRTIQAKAKVLAMKQARERKQTTGSGRA
jgi:hypothetical protein